MSDDLTSAVTTFRESRAFELVDDGFRVTTVELDAVVTITKPPDKPGLEYRLTVTAPDIDAVVVGETVADVVREGWFETFERRLADPHQVGIGLDPIEPTVLKDDGSVHVRLTFTESNVERARDNAKSLAEFVEGTWVEGLIPGYEYRGPAKTLLGRAMQQYDGT